MALSTYSDLKTSVANWLHRTDLTDVIPDFITLAEERLNSDLNSRSQDVKVNLSAVSGVATVELPSDMVEMRRLQIVSSYNTVLKYVTPDQLSADYNSNTSGIPQVFTIVGSNIELAPVPDSTYVLELTYKQRIPALSSTNTTNWLLTNWPKAYLYGALCEAQPYVVNNEQLQVFRSLYQESVKGINDVDWYSGTTMRVKAK